MKTKSLLIILTTLALGILIGILGTNYFRTKRIKEYRSYTTVDGFTHKFLKAIEPTEEQKEQILPIIKEYSKRNHDLRKEYRNDFRKLIKEFNEELKPVLTKEQLEKLEQGRKDSRERKDDGKRGGGRRTEGRRDFQPPW